ncbi:MAG: TetR/AcrR family transcriptional regulator [Bacillota bacterium]|nr:TetR/AcrR family transcriptional regulator [Bacillota bacterium]
MAKTDRRTLYTKGVIKDALLEKLQEKIFTEITVTEICRTAEINRGTFYIHYDNLTAVLNELIDEVFQGSKSLFQHLGLDSNGESASKCSLPFCLHVQKCKKYKAIFLDDSLTCYTIKRLSNYFKEEFVENLMAKSALTRKQAEAIFIFQINGCFAVNKAVHWNQDTSRNWCPIQGTIDDFIANGIQGFIKKNNN